MARKRSAPRGASRSPTRPRAPGPADEATNAFIAMLVHELRNPLAALTNAVELAFAEELPAEKRALGQSMLRRQLARLGRMVDDLLDASRLTQGKIRLQLEAVDVGALVKQVLAKLEATVGRTEMPEVALDLPAAPVVIHADPVRLEQVLTHLLDNACRFSRAPRRVWITVAIAGGAVEIGVRDNGMGIPTDLLPRIFDLFPQSDLSTRRRAGGLGIGLTLVKHLTELHGGSVRVSSPGPDQGSEFVLRLPLH